MNPSSKDSDALLKQGVTSFAWFLNNQPASRHSELNGEESKMDQLNEIKKMQELEQKFNNYQNKKTEVGRVPSYLGIKRPEVNISFTLKFYVI